MGDRYLALLGCVLLGYAVIGKGFAYIGFPPLFIGELCAVLGLLAFLLSGRFVYTLVAVPNVFLALAMGWVLIRTLPYIGLYGIEALRDSVIVMYGVFGLIVSTLVIARPSRLERILDWYRWFIPIFLFVAPLSLILTRYADALLPRMPFGNVPVILLKSGDAGVHLAGVAIAALLGLYRVSAPAALGGLVAFGLIATDSRAGMLTIMVALSAAALLTGRFRQLLSVSIAAIVGVFCLYLIETQILERTDGGAERRSLSVAQLLDNVTSIFVKTQTRSDVEGTKEWRLLWWGKIIDNTLHGPYFWTGRGFGINLAEADGFLGTDNAEGPPLRSPHSAHMTMLARAGIPGLALWAAVLASWLAMILCAAWRARALGQQQWYGWLIFIACYGLAFVVNASFDVALEGPMQGIWFWCLYGFGIGATMLFYAGLAIDTRVPTPQPLREEPAVSM